MDYQRSHIPKNNPPKQFCEWSFELGDRKWQQVELELVLELVGDFFGRKKECVGAGTSGGEPPWAHEAGGVPRGVMLLPALSRAEPEFFIRTSAGKSRRKAAIPSAFFLFDEKQIDISISESVFLTQLISPPSSLLAKHLSAEERRRLVASGEA